MEVAQEITQLLYANTNNLVKELCAIGIVQEITGNKRNRAFTYGPYLSIFNER